MLEGEEDRASLHPRRSAASRKRSQNGMELSSVGTAANGGGSGSRPPRPEPSLANGSSGAYAYAPTQNRDFDDAASAQSMHSWDGRRGSFDLNRADSNGSGYGESDAFRASAPKEFDHEPHRETSFDDYDDKDDVSLVLNGADDDDNRLGGDDDDERKSKLAREDTVAPAMLNSDRSTAAHMFISFVGAGVLGLPYAFMKTGLLGSVLVVSIVGSMSTYAMSILVDCKIQLQQQGKLIRGYGDIAFGVLGSTGSSVVDFLLILTQVAFCCAYILFIGENVHSVMPSFSNSTIILLTIPGLSLLALFRHIKHLSPFALVADVANILGMLVVISFDVEVFREHETHMQSPLRDVVFGIVFANLPYFFGVAIYCYEGVGVILNIQESMQNKTNFRRILVTTMTAVTTVYVVFGSLGYIAYGAATKEIITLNLGAGVPTKVVKLALSTGLFFTFPLMMFPVYTIIETSPLIVHQSQCVKSVVRIVIVFGAVFIAIGIPNFGDFISLVGAGACALLALVLPAYFHLRICNAQMSKMGFVVDVTIIVVGTILGIIGTIHAGQELFSKLGADTASPSSP
ncbi:Amino acid transporter AVT3B [Hondaea fermentalgiana]|uniref:Amino acid transporter AVT3B n=1 Tax=Hondaea fermentalgiana TaxID=2315210 RepID=A0A2R5GUV8_9STRA|nr:Amino acid transporter AVT3B [Hondaea fermentalgiana]|eukprot:GBG31704.1 Amino acid transporter AVT3B [Hondaea fermentalgiana]